MKILLVTTPVLTEQSNYQAVKRLIMKNKSVYSSPQIGILILASLFRNNSWDVEIIDINSYYVKHLEKGNIQNNFCSSFSEEITNSKYDFIGFSTICSSYHFTLKIAENVKKIQPKLKVLLGGPQATATAYDTMKKFSFIDYILRGEAENSIDAFTKYYSSNTEKIPNLTWRNNGEIVLNDLINPSNINELPFPAYDLCNIRNIEVMHIEGGRGCPFNCKFCSTNNFFGRNYRIKSINRLMDESLYLVKKYKINNITFVHDNLFISKKKCLEFCKEWIKHEELNDVYWTCSLRFDFIDNEIIDALSSSNCSGVFFGIESGSERMQSLINKSIDIKKIDKIIRKLNSNGIHTTTSFIIGFPEENESDLSKTLDVYLNMLRLPLNKPQCSILAILPNSGYSEEHFNNLTYTGGISSMAHQGSSIPDDLKDMIIHNPKIFSSHHTPNLQFLAWDFINECEHFLKYVTGLYRWLIVFYCKLINGSLYILLLEWYKYLKIIDKCAKGFNYYSSSEFRIDLDNFSEYLLKNKIIKNEHPEVLKFLTNLYSSENVKKSLKKITFLADKDNQKCVRIKCAIFKTDFSFKEIVDNLINNSDLQLLKRKSNIIISYIFNEEIVIEEPSILTANILNIIKDKTSYSEVLIQMRKSLISLLPKDLVGSPIIAFKYILSKLKEQNIIDY